MMFDCSREVRALNAQKIDGLLREGNDVVTDQYDLLDQYSLFLTRMPQARDTPRMSVSI